MEVRSWPSEWLRGVLGASILAIVAEGETYGYRIGQRIAEAGLGTVKGGTLYPILNRFEGEGLLASTWREGDGGPGRKYYTVTPSGVDALRSVRADWAEFSSNATAAILGKGRST